MPRGPLGFLLFWIAALAAGTAFVMATVGGRYAWLLLLVAAVVVLLLVSRSRGRGE